MQQFGEEIITFWCLTLKYILLVADGWIICAILMEKYDKISIN